MNVGFPENVWLSSLGVKMCASRIRMNNQSGAVERASLSPRLRQQARAVPRGTIAAL
jgi:hypothetical protein